MKPALLTFFTLLFCCAFSQSQVSEETPVFTNLFSTQNQRHPACYRIPTLAVAPNGDMIAVADERVPSCKDLRDNPDINLVLRRSIDKGNNWLPMEKIVDYPLGQSASDASIIVDRWTNQIFLFFNFMDLKAEKNVYYFKMIKSTDNGKTWTPPTDITSQITKPEWHHHFKFITSGKGVQTSSGTLVHTLVNVPQGAYLFYSNNHGKGWQVTNTPIYPADESKVIELADGQLMVNSRVNHSDFRYVHISGDQGNSWVSRPDSSLIDPGCNASIIRYPAQTDSKTDNILLFCNPKSKNKRSQLTIRISYNEGKTWSKGKTIYPGSAAYSSLCELANGEIGLLFEKDNYSGICFTKFPLSWLSNTYSGIE